RAAQTDLLVDDLEVRVSLVDLDRERRKLVVPIQKSGRSQIVSRINRHRTFPGLRSSHVLSRCAWSSRFYPGFPFSKSRAIASRRWISLKKSLRVDPSPAAQDDRYGARIPILSFRAEAAGARNLRGAIRPLRASRNFKPRHYLPQA